MRQRSLVARRSRVVSGGRELHGGGDHVCRASIEKDYFCSLLLGHLATVAGDFLVFKGGTCQARCMPGFIV